MAARGSALASPAYQRRPRRSCSTSLDSAIGEPAAGVTSLPLSDADLRDGCVRLSGGFEGDMLAQAAGCLTVKVGLSNPHCPSANHASDNLYSTLTSLRLTPET